jgi:glycerophosphoryl diester phosphodiesterase
MNHVYRLPVLAVAVLMLGTGSKMAEEEATPARIEVIAHRGASAAAPENTMAAFRLAKDVGADWFELDCMLCKSGEVVVMHDSTVDRTTNGSGNVADLTLTDLRKLDAGSWKDAKFVEERIPTLAEALELTGPGYGCYIEVKSAGRGYEAINNLAAGKLARDAEFDAAFVEHVQETPDAALARAVITVVRECGKSKHVVVQSFSPVVCAVIAVEAPDLRVELLGSDRSAEAWEGYFRWALLFGFHGVNTNAEAINETRLGLLLAAGKSCAVYTVNSADGMRRFARLGVTGIITDEPALCIAELQQIKRR